MLKIDKLSLVINLSSDKIDNDKIPSLELSVGLIWNSIFSVSPFSVRYKSTWFLSISQPAGEFNFIFPLNPFERFLPQ